MAVNYDVYIRQNYGDGTVEFQESTFQPAANSLLGFNSSKVAANVTATVATGGIVISSGAISIAPASITQECTSPNSTEDYLIISDNGVLSKITVGNLMTAADKYVAVDAAATPGYLGVDGASGVLRVTTNDLTVTDGGNYITLSLGTNAMKKVAAPASAAASGVAGTFAYDNDYFYSCVATDTWKRTALCTWS